MREEINTLTVCDGFTDKLGVYNLACDGFTDKVVTQTLVDLLKNDGHKLQEVSPATVDEDDENVRNILILLVSEFRSTYKERLQKMSEDLLKQNGFPSILPSLVLGVANDLFSQGITWARIIALLAFSTELISICLSNKNVPKDVVHRIIRFVVFYVKRSLFPWINDHDGWDGLVDFSKKREPPQSSQKSLVKNLMEGAIRAFGIFASASNALTNVTA